jgi:hypothetical protein
MPGAIGAGESSIEPRCPLPGDQWLLALDATGRAMYEVPS